MLNPPRWPWERVPAATVCLYTYPMYVRAYWTEAWS